MKVNVEVLSRLGAGAGPERRVPRKFVFEWVMESVGSSGPVCQDLFVFDMGDGFSSLQARFSW